MDKQKIVSICVTKHLTRDDMSRSIMENQGIEFKEVILCLNNGLFRHNLIINKINVCELTNKSPMPLIDLKREWE